MDPHPHPDAFDRLARLARALADVPAALVFGWEDGDRRVLGADGIGRGDDAGARGLRPAATLPLGGDEGAAGSLVVLDHRPRAYGEEVHARLADVAAAAAEELAWRRRARESRDAADAHDALLSRERAARARAEAAERRAAFLAQVGTVLDDSLDYREAFRTLVRLTIPYLADYCLIDEMEADGGTRRIARAHVDPEKEKILYADIRHPPGSDPDRHPLMGVLRGGSSVLVGEVTDDVIDAIAHDDHHRRGLTEVLRLHSFVIVPLVARGRVLGLITLAFSESRRRYGPEDLALAEEMARRAALAIDNARLYGQAQQAVRAREVVLGIVGHDLRNPLASILLNTTTLLDLAPEGLPVWVADSLRETIALVKQGNRLIEDLLDVSRLSNGGIPLLRAPHDARDLASSGVRMLAPLARDRGVALEVELPDAPVPVHADGDRVMQVLGNVVGNALKFTPAGGRVVVRVEADAGGARVTVRDTGVGMDPAAMEPLFDVFRQADPRDRRGVGLGLPIARGIVEAHGGRLWADSRPGEGSTFTFTLPAPSPALDHAQEQGKQGS